MKTTSSSFLLTILGFTHFQSARGWIPLEQRKFYVEIKNGHTYEGRMLEHSSSGYIPDWIEDDPDVEPRMSVFIYKAQEANVRYHDHGRFGVILRISGRRPSYLSVPSVTEGPTFAEMRFEGEGYFQKHYIAGPFTKYIRPPPPQTFFHTRTIPPIDHVYIWWQGAIYMAPLRHDREATRVYNIMDEASSQVSPDRGQGAAVHDPVPLPR